MSFDDYTFKGSSDYNTAKEAIKLNQNQRLSVQPIKSN